MKINSKNKSRHFGHAYDTFLRWCGKEVVGPSRDWSCEPLNLLQYLLPLSYTSKEGCHDHSRNVWFCSYYEFVKFLYIVCLDSVVVINQFLDNFSNVVPQPNKPCFCFPLKNWPWKPAFLVWSYSNNGQVKRSAPTLLVECQTVHNRCFSLSLTA